MMPENGARISIFASFASASCSVASAILRLLSASSLACEEMKLLLARSTARSYLVFASVRFARACCVSACGTAGSSCTSSMPLATRWPSWKLMALMRPATSGRSVTDSSERRLPTAVMVCGSETVATFAASTVTTDGAASPLPLPCDDATPFAPEGAPGPPARCVPNQYAPPTAAATAIAATTPETALFIGTGTPEARWRCMCTTRPSANRAAARRPGPATSLITGRDYAPPSGQAANAGRRGKPRPAH